MSKVSDIIKVVLSFVVFGGLFAMIMLFFRDSLYKELLSSARKIYRKSVPDVIRISIGKVFHGFREARYRLAGKAFPHKCQYYCPCCGIHLASFVSTECLASPDFYNPERYAHTNNDVICPVCDSMPWHRIFAHWCEEHMDLLKSSEILYFAPEDGMMRWMKRHHIACTTADLYQKADLKIDIQDIGLPGQSWDIIICNHVLEHVEDFRKALKELHRILKPGGHLICSFPMDPSIEIVDEADPAAILTPEERLQRFGQADHLRVFGMKADLLLEEAIFKVERILGETCPPEVLPVVGPADYDVNWLFLCSGL